VTKADELKLIVVEELQCALGGFVNNKITDRTLRNMARAAHDVFYELRKQGWFDDVPKVIVEQSFEDPNTVVINFIDNEGEIRPLKQWFWSNF
jgi:hypothetical protein